jgi:ribosomal protein L35AE/L33A
LLGSGNIATGTGTVTSVGLNVSVAAFTLTATANPITTSGTFTIAAAGDSTQYINGAGNLVTFPTFSSTSLVVKTVRNQTGVTLTAGTVVYINGASGNIATVAKADNTTDSASAQTFGVTQAAISNNSNGVIVLIGDVTDLNTSAYTDGTQLYLGTNGTFTATKPYAPTHLVYVGIVTRAHATLGVITVKIQNGYELDELHDVSAQSPANNDGIFFNTSTSLWEKKSISTVLGYVPQAVLSGTGFVKSTAGTISYDTSTYLTANQSITLSGDVSGSGTTSISTTLATVTQASSGNFVKVTLDTKGRVTGNTAVLAADIIALGFASSLITTNRQTASYTLVLTDANKLVELNVATANTLTVPLNSSVAFPIGTQILVSQYGAGACTITPISGVTVRSEGAKLKTNGQYSGATLVKIATDEWYAFGNLIA